MQPRSLLAKWLTIAAISLVSAAAGWKIADTLQQSSGSTVATIDADGPEGQAPVHSTADQTASSTGADTPELDPDALENTTLAEMVLMLKLIFPATENQGKTAIIQYKSRQADAFETGQPVFGIATLEEIHEDHVILVQGSRKVRLSLFRKYASNDADADTAGPTDAENTNEEDIYAGVEAGNIREYAARAAASIRKDRHAKPAVLYTKAAPFEPKGILEEIKKRSLETSSELTWAFLQYEPEMQVDGMKGLRLTGQSETEFLARHGLEYGDVITSVNGARIDSPSAAMEGINTIGASDTLELVVDRGGQTRTLSVNKKSPPGK